MEGNAYDFFLESNRTNEKDVRKGIVIVEAFAQKFCRILTTDEESRATTCSLIVSAAFPRGTREIIFPSTYTRARARWWNVRKCAARSSLHARTEFIVPCSIALNRPWEIAIRASVRRVRLSFERIIPIEIYSYPIKFLIGCDFLLSSKSRETSIIVVSPRHTLRNFHPSLETSVRWISRKRWFTSNRAAALRYFSCGAVTC